MVETNGLSQILEGDLTTPISIRVTKRNGEVFDIPTKHTMSADQLKWLRAGSALNHIRSTIE